MVITMHRTTPRMEPPKPEEPKPDDWTPPEMIEEECLHCGTVYDRHPDDPPACSSACWNALIE